MDILAQFLLRLAFGLAVGMAITCDRQVSSGFFRIQLYVALGLATFAAVMSYAAAPAAFWYAIGAAAVSYVGSVCWLYEKREAGKVATLIVMVVSLNGGMEIFPDPFESQDGEVILDRYFPVPQGDISAADANRLADRSLWMGHLSGGLSLVSDVSSGLLLGITMAAMLLGHWYLNSPTMELAPLRRLLVAMGAAVVFQAIVSAIGLACEREFATGLSTQWMLFVLLRWSFGLVGAGVLAWMAWQTLKIPNTQSTTGILYVAVIGVFVGELASQLLSAESAFPL